MRGITLSTLLFVSSLLVIPSNLPAQQLGTYSHQFGNGEADGVVRETIDGLVITPMPNAPFTATLDTEWVKNMSDGGTMTLINQRRIARDRKGRIYEERWMLVPKSGKFKSVMTAIQIADPLTHIVYTCMMDGKHVCTPASYTDKAIAAKAVRGNRNTPLPNNDGFVSLEDLGDGSLEGVDTIGTRITTTYNAGVLGNDDQFEIQRETWYSPQLGINLLSKISDPRSGTQTFTITELSTSEPDQKLFNLPDGFHAADQRAEKATQ